MLPLNFTPARSTRRLAPIVAAYLLLNASTYISSRASVNATDVSAAPPILISPTVLLAEQDVLGQFDHDDGDGDKSAGYAPEFDYFDRTLLGRQEPQPLEVVVDLEIGEKRESEILPGETRFFVLKSGQAGDRVWISANTCRQPVANGTEPPVHSRQLDMFVSTSPNNQKPRPTSTDGLVTPPTGLLFDEGFASLDVNTTSDIYIGVSAPNPEKDWMGSWSFEIAASVNGPYHSYNASDTFLYMIDTDSESALFITYDLSEPNTTDADKWRSNNPFSMYAFEVGDQSNITGMEHSLCALKSVFGNSTLNTSTTITTKFGGNKFGDNVPKSQFHIQGLKKGTKYNGFLTVEGGKDVVRLPGGGAVRDGGMVFQSFEWTTKVDDSCQVLFDLEFCDSVAYAVPSSPQFTSDTNRLKALYDEQAKNYYTNFTRSLAQVACDTTSEAQYSLARNCTHCEEDYKTWLCSVLIPRCEDWTATDNFLQERNINVQLPDGNMTHNNNVSEAFKEEKRDRFAYNRSRNPMIDKDIRPGPYKEMLPCEDLCFDIVRSCPAQLGFSCPNNPARELTYGKRDPTGQKLTCSFPGAVVKLNVQAAAGVLSPRLGHAIVATILVVALGWM